MSSQNIIGAVIFIYVVTIAIVMIKLLMKKELLSRFIVYAIMGGFVLHTAGIFLRWYESYSLGFGHVPLSNLYESLVFFSWSLVFIAIMILKWNFRIPVLSIIPVSAIMLAYASFSPGIDRQIQPLIPALKSNLLSIHVITCFFGYAFFTVGSVWAFFMRRNCLSDDRPKREQIFYRCIMLGYIFFTLGILTGSIWGQVAWGRYWGWDPKETWALITWLIYAAVIHERIRGGRVTQTVSVYSYFGLASILFTYFGVNYLSGLHSYF
jgi:ABC-type transport system involved in cytochrome c biogenesis permease subunit